LLGSQRRIILKGITTQTKKLKALRSCQNFGFIDRTSDREKAIRRVRDEFGQDAVDSGQEHLANSDNGFPVTTTGFDSAVAIGEFRVLFGTNQRIGDPNKTRFEISSGAGNACRLDLASALIVSRTAACPRAKMFGGREKRTCRNRSPRELQWR
jgi:hypothetical protein